MVATTGPEPTTEPPITMGGDTRSGTTPGTTITIHLSSDDIEITTTALDTGIIVTVVVIDTTINF